MRRLLGAGSSRSWSFQLLWKCSILSQCQTCLCAGCALSRAFLVPESHEGAGSSFFFPGCPDPELVLRSPGLLGNTRGTWLDFHSGPKQSALVGPCSNLLMVLAGCSWSEKNKPDQTQTNKPAAPGKGNLKPEDLEAFKAERGRNTSG